MVMMAHRMPMTMTVSMTAAMAALGQCRAGQCKAGCNDQRRSERKFLHNVLHGVSAFVRLTNERCAAKFPANVEES